jgi:hypothetical protein
MGEGVRERLKNMTGRQKAEYIVTYYWNYMLGACAAIGIVILLCYHFLSFANKPVFTCVLVNQSIDYKRDEALEQQLSLKTDMNEKRIVFDSDYNISYGDITLEGVNESSYEKFFLKWSAGELDAILMPESFYQYCKELGGIFRHVSGEEEILFLDGGEPAGIRASATWLGSYLKAEEGDPVIIVFPIEGKNHEMTDEFIKFLRK